VVGTAGDPADLKFKLLYLAAISVKADKPSHPLPPCGGPLQPEFSDEVAAYQLALSGSDDGKAGAYAKQLAEVNKAGFLKEYIWINRHQSSWGSTEPKGLKLAKFRKWSRKNLKPVAATQLGYVNITQVRELPVEPLSGAE
jgi:hypothetical protein